MFAAFSYSCYYPSGGWNDLAGVFDTVEAAKVHLFDNCKHEDYWQIVNLSTGKLDCEGSF